MPTQLEGMGIGLGGQAASGLLGAGMGLLLQGGQDRRQIRQQRKLQDLQMEGSKQMTDYNMAKQFEMWQKTGYGAQMKQMKEAGLNPGLLYGIGGGGGQTPGAATGQVSAGSAPHTGGEAMQGMGIMNNAQLALLGAQTENIKADTANKQANVPKTGAETENIKQDTINKQAQETLTRVDTELRQVQASVARQTISDAMATIENQAKKSYEELTALKLQNALSQDQYNDKVKHLKMEIASMAIKNALTNAQTRATNQEIKNKIQEVLESEQRIKTMAGQLMINWDEHKIHSAENTRRDIDWTEHDSSWDFIKDVVPGLLIPIGKGFGGKNK